MVNKFESLKYLTMINWLWWRNWSPIVPFSSFKLWRNDSSHY